MQKYIIGIDVGGTKMAVTLADCKENFLGKERFATAEMPSPRATVEKTFEIIEKLLVDNGITSENLCGIGISCGGPLDDKRGVILSPPNLPGWDEVPIVKWYEERFGVPAYLKNDADACAIAEWKFGAGRGCENMVFLTFGTGLGAGLILNGRPYSGACSMAGEAGHIRLAPNGPVGYGKEGSFEGFCSGGGIAQLAEMIMGEKLSAKDVATLARDGDEKALEVMKTCGEYLGRGLSILIDILNPERIILGGVYMRASDLLYPYAKAVIEKESLSYSKNACEILPAGLGEKIGDWAAISIVAERCER